MRSPHIEPAAAPAEDFWLQYALGRLVTSPAWLDRALRHGAAALGEVPEATQALLLPMLQRQGRRIRIVAQILDERLLKNVLRFLPLTAAAGAPALLSQLWRAFRHEREDADWRDHHACARAFCASACARLRAEAAGVADERIADLMRYEGAVLRMDARARTVHAPRTPASDSVVGWDARACPAPVACCEQASFAWSISECVRALRAGGAAAAPCIALPAAESTPETLLFFASWHDRQVRTLRVAPAVLALMAACEGCTTVADLSALLGRPGCPAALQGTLHKLQQIGLLRPAEPATHPQPALTSEDSA
ncbi:MAG: hypothetical protein JSR59_22185 [Proteobacteria bacterium]|nr:hypothetical protein [Pseudomonadota bacterium]